jgi:hypothetical protein
MIGTNNLSTGKKKCGGIFFYLEKAFDCVDHNILMNKINYYGVNGDFFINKVIFIQ